MAGIAAWATAIPMWRLQRAMLGTAWDTPALPGERAVAAGDQDSLTLGAEAALGCVADAEQVDAIFFATTTPPYAEKHAAATIAGVLDRFDVRTSDITGSIRSGTSALRAAIDAVDSGTVRAALVVVADMRPAEPATASEQLFGDAAAALLVTQDGPVRVLGAASIAEETAGPWRRSRDDYVRNFDAKFETEFGYARSIETAARKALEQAGISADAITRFAAYAPDPRTFVTTAKRIGLGQVKDPLFTSVGNLGAAHAIVSLAHALDEAAAGEHIVVAAAGEGADAIVLSKTTDPAHAGQTVAEQIARKRILPTYERYVRFRRLIPSEDPDPSRSSRRWQSASNSPNRSACSRNSARKLAASTVEPGKSRRSSPSPP